MEIVDRYVFEAGMPITPSQVSDQLRRLRNRSGLSMKKLALKMGYAGASSIQRYESPAHVEYLDPELAVKFADALAGLGVPPIEREEVLELAGNIRLIDENIGENPNGPNQLIVAASNLSPYGLRDLPIYGQARGGDDCYVFENGSAALSFTYRPMELLSVRDAYAVYVNGHSMSPRFKNGELVYVDPHRPISPGDDVIIQLHDGQGYIKELVRRTGRAILCRQHNPPGEVEFAASDVRSIHLIVSATRVRV